MVLQPGENQLVARITVRNSTESLSPRPIESIRQLTFLLNGLDQLLVAVTNSAQLSQSVVEMPSRLPPWDRRRVQLIVRQAGDGSFELVFDVVSVALDALGRFSKSDIASALNVYMGIGGGAAGIGALIATMFQLLGPDRPSQQSLALHPQLDYVADMLGEALGPQRMLELITSEGRQLVDGEAATLRLEARRQISLLNEELYLIVSVWGDWLELRQGNDLFSAEISQDVRRQNGRFQVGEMCEAELVPHPKYPGARQIGRMRAREAPLPYLG